MKSLSINGVEVNKTADKVDLTLVSYRDTVEIRANNFVLFTINTEGEVSPVGNGFDFAGLKLKAAIR